MKSLCWIRREIRLHDNRLLEEASRTSDEIYVIYIFDEETMNSRNMSIKDPDPRVKLILEALLSLNSKIPVHVLCGNLQEKLRYLFDNYKLDCMFVSEPFSWSEEKLIYSAKKICDEYKIRLNTVYDNTIAILNNIGSTRNFTDFYSYWKKAIDCHISPDPPLYKFKKIGEKDVHEFIEENKIKLNENMWNINFVENRLKSFPFRGYSTCRDYPYLDCTSKLSPYISLGIISVRTLYNFVRTESEEFVRQLAWREYYYYLAKRNPTMKNIELKKNLRNIQWENDKYYLECFINGKTGYPLVDAGMRQLRSEWWIHNRVRLVVANFLTKVLHIDWKIGERLFRERLIDYDEALNVGNWQWSASVGVDPLPFRYFSPIIQLKKYDPHCRYIKKYIPELENVKCSNIQNLKSLTTYGYIDPIVDYSERINKFKEKLFNKNI